MAKILDMPKLSPTMEEGVLATWHKKEGDAVNVDDLLAEVETDKATMEFRAFDKGTLLKLLVEAGATVKLGQPVAVLGNPGEDFSELVAEAGSGEAAAPPAKAKGKKDEEAPQDDAQEEQDDDEQEEQDDDEQEEQDDDEQEEQDDDEEKPKAKAKPKAASAPAKKKPAASGDEKAPSTLRPPAPIAKGNMLSRTERDRAPAARTSNGERVLASPYVRKVARERGIDLAGAQGSGEHGRIVPADLESIGSAKPATSKPDTSAPLARRGDALARQGDGLAAPESRPLSPMRKTIARRLTQAKQTVPHFYLTIDVDADALVALRESINKDLAASATPKNPEAKPEKISLNDMIVKACAAALVRVPECNAQFTDEAILIHRRVDISVAVAVPDGLLTPVVRNADQKSVVSIGRETRDLAARARGKKLKPEEMTDGTFSISNLGMFGIDEFSAVINPPEGAILAVGQVRDEPVVRNGAVVPGKKLAMTLSCDHRVVDGAVGAAFLAELRALLEHPMRILTG